MLKPAALALLALLAGSPAFADDPSASPQDVTQVINLYGKTLVFPPPYWVPATAGAASAEMSEYYRKQEGNNFLFEAVPKAEGFDNWTSLYAVLAIQDSRATPEFLANDIKRSFGQGCKRVVLEPVTTGDDGLMIVMYCESFLNDPGRGEIGVFRILKTGDVTAKIYHEWRAKAYEFDKTETWPVPRSDVDAVIARFKDVVKLLPSSGETDQ